MKNNQNLQELLDLRQDMILNNYSRKSLQIINEQIQELENEYLNSINEDGEGSCASGDSYSGPSGMGSVVSPQPSTVPGTTIGSAWSDNGGTEGSGDVSNLLFNGRKNNGEMGRSHGPRTGKKSRVKKMDLKHLRDNFKKKQDYTNGEGGTKSKKIMGFDSFQKDEFNKVTRVKE